MIEVETGFQNVFGHDEVRNPVKCPPARPARGHRGGVPALPALPRARGSATRASGRCSSPRPACRTAPTRSAAAGRCPEHPRRLRVPGRQHPAARPAPWRDRLQRRGRLRRQGLPGPAALARAARRRRGSSDGGGSGPRTLKVRNPPMRGKDVVALQKLVNRRFAEFKVGARIAEDGEFGPETRTAARRVAYALGLGGLDAGITPAHRVKMRQPTPAHARRARPRRGAQAVAEEAAGVGRAVRRVGQLPARRARADHRPALPGHPHARELAVRQRASTCASPRAPP